MKIKREDVEYVAELARLYISEEQKEKLTQEMGNIIVFADKLSELEDADVPVNNTTVYNVFRDDKIKESFDREDLLKNAPDKQAGCYCVPRIVE